MGRFLKKSSPLKPLGQLNRHLAGSTYERFCIKFPQNKMAGERHKLCPPTMFFVQRGRNEEIVEMLPCKLLLYLAKWFQKVFRNRSTSNKNCLWRPCLLADRDEMSNKVFYEYCSFRSDALTNKPP
jgi:hypothetical protein